MRSITMEKYQWIWIWTRHTPRSMGVGLFKVAAVAKTISPGMDGAGMRGVDRQLAETSESTLLTVRCISCDYRRWYERGKSNYFGKWKHKRFYFSSWHPNDIWRFPVSPSLPLVQEPWLRPWGLRWTLNSVAELWMLGCMHFLNPRMLLLTR